MGLICHLPYLARAESLAAVRQQQTVLATVTIIAMKDGSSTNAGRVDTSAAMAVSGMLSVRAS